MVAFAFGLLTVSLWLVQGRAFEQGLQGIDYTQDVQAVEKAAIFATRNNELLVNEGDQAAITRIDVPMNGLRRDCGLNVASWWSDPWGCFAGLFFSAGSFSDWILNAFNNDNNAQALVTRILKRCGSLALSDLGIPNPILPYLSFEEPGPFDAVVCDLVNVARTGDTAQFDLLYIDQCVEGSDETIATDCRNQFLSTGSKSEMLKTLLSAVTGYGGGNGSGADTPDFISSIAARYQSCTSTAGADEMGCLSMAFVGASCEGLCRTSSCQIDRYQAAGTAECQAAVLTGCPAFSTLVEEACSALYAGVDNSNDFLAGLGDPTQGECDFCPTIIPTTTAIITTAMASATTDGSTTTSIGVFTFASFLLWLFGA